MWPLSKHLNDLEDVDSVDVVDSLQSKKYLATSAVLEVDEANAAMQGGAALFFSGGCYDRKVIPMDWSENGEEIFSSGGHEIVKWNIGKKGEAPPVRKNHRATLLNGHGKEVTWIGCQQDLVASMDVNGILMVHQNLTTEIEKKGVDDEKIRFEKNLMPWKSSEKSVGNGCGPVLWGLKNELYFGNGEGMLCVAKTGATASVGT